MDRDEVEVRKTRKKRTRLISSHLDRTNLVNKGFIILLLVKFCLRDTAGSPERARWLHLARSGSQSHRAIWFILPAHGARHIIIRNNSGFCQYVTSVRKTLAVHIEIMISATENYYHRRRRTHSKSLITVSFIVIALLVAELFKIL